MLEWVIIGDDVGKKLVDFLIERVGDRFSAKAIRRALELSGCHVNGKIQRYASAVLKRRDHIELNLELLKSPPPPPKVETSRILFEDKDLLIYNKPAGISCDPNGILKLLRPYHRDLYLVHRLDKETTGVLLLTKNRAALDKLIEQFKEKNVKKCYLAIVDGILENRKGSIKNHLIKKFILQGQSIMGSTPSKDGMFAHTDWECLKQGHAAALVACYPVTGRMHQIRVHMAEMGHPILGDFQYGKNFYCEYRTPRYLLHAYEVRFEHEGKELVVEAPLPDDFIAAEKALFKGK